MLNLFQHPDLSMSYETLKRVQGDKFGFVQQAQDSDKTSFSCLLIFCSDMLP